MDLYLSAGDEGGCGWTGTWGQVNQYIIQHRKFTPFETDSCPFITQAEVELGLTQAEAVRLYFGFVR